MTANRTSSRGRTARQSGRVAADRRADAAAKVAAPEQVVVTSPPPDPDYPRYRVDPERGIRLADPGKRWKFSANDLKERVLWDDYQVAFEEAIDNCSTYQHRAPKATRLPVSCLRSGGDHGSAE